MPTVSKKQEKFMQAVANNPEFAEKVGVNQSIGREFIKGKDMKKNYMYGGKVKKMMSGGKVKKMAPGGLTKPGMTKVPTALMDQKMSKEMKRMMDLQKQAERMRKRNTTLEKTRALPASRANIGQAGPRGAARMGAGLGSAATGALQGMRVGMNKGGKVKKMNMGGPTARTKRIMNEKDEIRRVDKEIRKNEGYRDGGKVKAFKAHMMYDKKTGKGVNAPTMAKHLELKKKGYGHTKGKKMMMGGKVKGYKMGGKVSSASKRADGIATKGHTRGRMV